MWASVLVTAHYAPLWHYNVAVSKSLCPLVLLLTLASCISVAALTGIQRYDMSPNRMTRRTSNQYIVQAPLSPGWNASQTPKGLGPYTLFWVRSVWIPFSCSTTTTCSRSEQSHSEVDSLSIICNGKDLQQCNLQSGFCFVGNSSCNAFEGRKGSLSQSVFVRQMRHCALIKHCSFTFQWLM